MPFTSPTPTRIGHRSTGICKTQVMVVDPRGDAYAGWPQAGIDVKLNLVSSGREALRLASRRKVDLWVINVDLPDMAGLDLCQMLKSRSPATPVYLVSDRHSPELERAAYAARASGYGAKPAQLDWLSQWLEHRRSRPVADRTD